MAKNKNFTLRLRVLDRKLHGGNRFSGKQLTEAVNNALEDAGLPAISSRSTLASDLKAIECDYHAPLEHERRGNTVFYWYNDPSFAIFSTQLSDDDISRLQQAMGILSRFEGMPQFEWMQELSASLRLNMASDCRLKECVGFESGQYNTGIEHFTPLFNAISQRMPLTMRYKSFKMDAPHAVIVHPYYLKQYNNRWFLLASNDGYDAISTYALDRIQALAPASVPYHDTAIDFDEYFDDVIGVTKPAGAQPQEVLLRFDNIEYPYVATKPWHGSQRRVAHDAATTTISLNVVLNYELSQRILSFGRHVEVLAPATLRQRIAATLTAAAALYSI